MTTGFWNDVNTEPKRQFRFQLSFSSKTLGPGAIPVWTFKTASKPKANISTIEHQYVDHTFKYPGRVTWDPITVTLVDPVDPDVAWSLLNVLGGAGYKYPTTSDVAKQSLSKKLFKDQIGAIYIDQIDDKGKMVERWELMNPFFTSIDFGGTLDYSSDEMNEVTVEITYDWANMRYTKAHGSGPPSAIR